MRVKKWLAICVIIHTASVSAQELAIAHKTEGRGFFAVSREKVDVSKLDASFTGNGYKIFSDQFFSLGGLGYSVRKNLILGGEGYALWGQKVNSKGYNITAGGGYGLFNIGLVIHHKNDCNLYPFLGVGGGALSVKIMEAGVPSFEEVLANPKRGSQLSVGGFMLSIGFGMDKIIKKKKRRNGEGGMALGMRVGYNFTPVTGDWVFDEELISGGPSLGIKGPYVRLLIGGGGTQQE
jgi:hypothetical protein